MGRIAKTILNYEEIEQLHKDYKSGTLSQRQLGEKYNISVTKVRDILGINKAATSIVQKQKAIEAKALVKNRKKRNRQIIHSVTVQAVESFIKGEFIDVFLAIRQGLQDLYDLNQEQRNAIPQIIRDIELLLKRVNEVVDPLDDSELIKDIYKALGSINSFYSRGKLRIESQREIRKFIETFKDLELLKQYHDWFENCINAMFFGLNEISDEEYIKFRNAATLHFPQMEIYFNKYEDTECKINEEIKLTENKKQ